MRLNDTSVFSAINLAEGKDVPRRIQVLRVGKFKHPEYGEFEITPKTLSDMKANFDKKVRGIDMAFDYFHASDKEASGWADALALSEDGTELFADVDWTPKASKMLAERELRYFSPDFAFKWVDPESGVAHSNVLFGGGLTNRPFVKEMKAIVAAENPNKGDEMNLQETQEALKLSEDKVKKLSEDLSASTAKLEEVSSKAEKVMALEAQIKTLQDELAKVKSENEMVMQQKELAEKESKFNVLLSEGKACAAQKDAFIKGDMEAFIKLAQPTNLKGNGSSSSETITDDKSAKIIKLAEQKHKESPNKPYGDCVSEAKKEIEAADKK